MAISPQQLTIYLYSAHRAVIFAIAQLSCYKLELRNLQFLTYICYNFCVNQRIILEYIEENVSRCFFLNA